MRFLRTILHAITIHPQRLLTAFIALMLLVGLSIFTVAGKGIHRVVDDSTSLQHRVLAHAAVHDLAQREIFEIDAEQGLALKSGQDLSSFVEQASRYAHSFNLFRVTIFDQQLKPLLVIPANAERFVEEDRMMLATVAESNAAATAPGPNDIVSIHSGENLHNRDTLMIHTPLHVGAKILGYASIGVDRSTTHDITHNAVDHAYYTLAIAITISMALLCFPMYLGVQALIQEHAELIVSNGKLKELASIDMLTKIYNRRTLTEQVQLEFERLRRNTYHRASLCVLMADIDHFKKINDTFGHLGGDQALTEVAARLKDAVRGYDVVGRYGGEEFLVMLPNTNEEGARVVGERILNKVRDLPIITTEHHLINVTISIGISIIEDPLTPETEAIAAADAALYQAKEEGRNRMIIRHMSRQTLHVA